MQVNFIRHGQSRGNIGLPCDSIEGITLTELGHQQAALRAQSWTKTPDLILISPYVRTHETAAPTIARFPQVPVEEWPIHEFNNLHPCLWKGEREARLAEEHRQWTACDPEYCDGGGTESFSNLHQRARAALDRLAKLPQGTLVYAFTHGYFMQAIRFALLHPELSAAERMRIFRPEDGSLPFANTEAFPLHWDGVRWMTLPVE